MRDATLSAPPIDAVRPARSAPGSRASAAGGKRPRQRPGATRRLSARLSVIVGSAGFCAIMIGIVINATMFQKGHHPAPLFASAAPARPVVAEPPPAVVPLPAVPVVAPPALPAAVDKRPLPPAVVRPPAAPQVAAPSRGAPAARHVDGIARLLGTLGERDAVKGGGRPIPPAQAKAALAKPAAPMAN